MPADEKGRPPEDCEAEVEELREENQQLRDSAQAFGDLAERLKQALELERKRRRAMQDEPGPA
jgi:hypothetical protein